MPEPIRVGLDMAHGKEMRNDISAKFYGIVWMVVVRWWYENSAQKPLP